MGILDRRAFRLGFAALALFTGMAGDFWRNLLTWYGWGAMIALVIGTAIVLLVHNRRTVRLGQLPYPLIAFLALATVSIAWSAYRLESVLGVVAQFATSAGAVAIAVVLSWAELLAVLGLVFRLILGLSLVFEFIVSAFVRHPIYPFWVVPDDPAHPAKLLYWSRNLLFEGGKIQGIVGNSSLLAMTALLGLIVFAVQLLSRTTGRVAGWAWIVVALAIIAITRSATIFVAMAAVAIVILAVLVIRAARSPRARGIAYGVILAIVAAGAAVAILFAGQLLTLLGKSADFTGRIGIWDAVIGLAQERPAFGWGWISYWVPWVPPFDHLIVRGGVQVLHAHDAWLDVWLQLGIAGLVVFGALVLSTLVRSWLFALDGTASRPDGARALSWVAVLPLLMLVAQLVQSIAESRILVEGGWMLLVLWAVRTKWSARAAELPDATRMRA